MRHTSEVYLFLLFAFIAMAFLILTMLLVPARTIMIPLDNKLMVSASFIASCCVGMSLAVYPGWFRKRLTAHNIARNRKNGPSTRAFSGHHPDCERFQAHRLTIGAKTWCAGCLGLLLGSLVSIFFMMLYVISSPGFSRNMYELLLLLGLILVVVVFLETVLQNRHPIAHVALNAILILGFFFVTMSVTELTGKGLFGVFTVVLCALWLNTRVTLSTWRHQRTCSSCTASCKMYEASSASR
ncbi:MAG TPA: hypothetical protein VMT57_03775 [Candidatus Thermoplasmatota archaeon]|nr:hypothetical protein [Candidatus Thermoplasmatota archaeon]